MGASEVMLTITERKLMTHLANGYRYPAIAEKMGYSYYSLKDITKDLRKQYNARNTTHLVAILLRTNEIT